MPWEVSRTIVGANRCVPGKKCRVTGIVTNKSARTITFRLTAPDPDFLTKLAMPASFPKTPSDSIVTYEQGQHLAMVAQLGTTQGSPPVAAILDYPLEEALSAYRAVITPMLTNIGELFDQTMSPQQFVSAMNSVMAQNGSR